MSLQLFLLLLLTVRSESVTVGKEFIAVFPENIAYYHPSNPNNKLRFTALYNSTRITLAPSNSTTSTGSSALLNLKSGDTSEIDINPALELDKSNISTRSVSITSNNDISVEILSYRNNSVQTALIFPTSQLGTQYRIPPIPQIQQTTTPTNTVTTDVTERSPFKLIIVNTKTTNTISQEGMGGLELQANQVAQVWVYTNMVGKFLNGTQPFLVLFGHSCAVQFDCTCGVLYTPLVPEKTQFLKYFVPPVFKENADNSTYLLKSDGKTQLFEPDKMSSFEFSGTMVLQRPGLLINLIPENEFGACFAVQTVAEAQNSAIIMVSKGNENGIQMGTKGLSGDWKDVTGTKYVYTKIELNSGKHFIWHKFDKMAVWFIGKKITEKDAWFGNPAALIAKEPDHRGCALVPEVLQVLQEGVSWQQSIQSCKNLNLSLISLSDPILQDQVYNQIRNNPQNPTELWIGMRRSSYTGEWYWINRDEVDHVDWGQGEPGGTEEGQCTLLNMKNRDNPGWTDEDCCRLARPVCYRLPELLTMS